MVDPVEQLSRRDLERGSQLEQVAERNVAHATLDLAGVAPVETGALGQLLLREPELPSPRPSSGGASAGAEPSSSPGERDFEIDADGLPFLVRVNIGNPTGDRRDVQYPSAMHLQVDSPKAGNMLVPVRLTVFNRSDQSASSPPVKVVLRKVGDEQRPPGSDDTTQDVLGFAGQYSSRDGLSLDTTDLESQTSVRYDGYCCLGGGINRSGASNYVISIFRAPSSPKEKPIYVGSIPLDDLNAPSAETADSKARSGEEPIDRLRDQGPGLQPQRQHHEGQRRAHLQAIRRTGLPRHGDVQRPFQH